jgi:hypothetical protein
MISGDPIELGAAAAVLLPSSQPTEVQRWQPLLASAGKSWVGHSEAAAGAMGLIHALQGLGERCTQPLLHLQAVNPYLEGPLKQQQQPCLTAPWSLPRQSAGLPAAGTAEEGSALITGVSSFAFQVREDTTALTAQGCARIAASAMSGVAVLTTSCHCNTQHTVRGVADPSLNANTAV